MKLFVGRHVPKSLDELCFARTGRVVVHPSDVFAREIGPHLLASPTKAKLGIPSANDVLGGDRFPWQAGYRSAAVGGATAIWSRSAQQRLNFVPEPHGQGALRPGLAGRVASRREAVCATMA